MYLAHYLAHFFSPRESNGFRATALKPLALFAFAGFIIFVQIAMASAPRQGVVLGYAADISVSEVINITNLRREERGLSILTENEDLSEAAMAKGRHMLENDYWAHVAPDGTEPWEFFDDVGYVYRYAGENLARDFSDADKAVTAWMASPTHRENMLSLRYQEIGVAVVEGDLDGVETTLIVQLFGTKMDAIAPVPIASATQIDNGAPLDGEVAGLPKVNVENSVVDLTQKEVRVSPFAISRGLSMAVVMVMGVTLALDVYVVNKYGVPRIQGRGLAHLSLLGMALVVLWLARAGEII